MVGWLNAFYTETASIQHTPLDFLKWDKVLLSDQTEYCSRMSAAF